MNVTRLASHLVCFGVLLLLIGAAGVAPAGDLIVNGDFEALKSGKSLRVDNKGQDWYESRKQLPDGRSLLKLSTKDIGGNATRKAMIKGHPDFNTYLTQRLPEAQTVSLRIQYDIYVKEILPDDNRSAFCFVGGIKDKKNGPNSTGRERFAFIGFENAAQTGKMNLFAREGETTWQERTIIARDLDLNRWYTISLELNVPEGVYEVGVEGVVDAFELEALFTKGKTPNAVTHLSFASWDDGAGTFYIDNVVATND